MNLHMKCFIQEWLLAVQLTSLSLVGVGPWLSDQKQANRSLFKPHKVICC